jgi:hypothetical protein
MKKEKDLAENIAYSIVAWFQTLGSTRFQLTVSAIAAVIIFGEESNSLLSNTQWTQICILTVTWLLGESIRPHAGIKNTVNINTDSNTTVSSNKELVKSDNEKLLDEAIGKLHTISGPSSPIGPLLKACIDVLETAREVLIKFRRF